MSVRSKNSRTNTVISQSFIASDFQGFNDNLQKGLMRTSGMMNQMNQQPNGFLGQQNNHNFGGNALNQMVRTKQVYSSGFMQQDGQPQMTQNKMFGFNNITSTSNNSQVNHQYQQEQFRMNAPVYQQNQYAPQIQTQQQINPNQTLNRSIYAQQQQPTNMHPQMKQNHMQLANRHQSQLIPSQKLLQQRYISPLVGKMDSPQKVSNQDQQGQQGQGLNQYKQQFQNQRQQSQVEMRRQSQQIYQKPVQFINNVSNVSNTQAHYQKSVKKGPNFESQVRQQPKDPQIRYQEQLRMIKQEQIRQQKSVLQKEKRQSFNLNRTEAYTSSASSYKKQSSSSNFNNNNLEQSASTTNLMKRLKLNISQQFSNSFTLESVKQPQKSNIIQMKKRQRQFRKAIQNFII